MTAPPLLTTLYDHLSERPLTLREVAGRFFDCDCVAARAALAELESRDLVLIQRANLRERTWLVIDQK